MVQDVLDKMEPKDLLAALIIILFTILLLAGYNGWVQGSMTLVLVFYFGMRIVGKDNGK